MNEALAALFGTGAQQDTVSNEDEVILQEMEKVASANNIDLYHIPAEELADIIYTYKEHLAGAPTGEVMELEDGSLVELPHGVTHEKLASARFIAEYQAHAYAAELGNIEHALNKTASMDEDTFNSMVHDRAEALLEAAVEANQKYKQSAYGDDDFENQLNLSALQLLDENDYDAEKIVDLLSNG